MKTSKSRSSKSTQPKTHAVTNCEIRLDRLIVGVPHNLPEGPPQLEGFKVVLDTLLRQRGAIRTYERVRWLKSRTNACKVSIQYKRLAPWLPAYRITIIADDRTGIILDEITRVLMDFGDHAISLLELAFDFKPDSPVNEEFVLRHMRFGKSQRDTKHGGPGTLLFGTRRSPKFVRCYPKQEIGRYRVELELHSTLLKQLGIRNIADLSLVATKLCPAHIAFKGLCWGKLDSHLIRRHGAQAGKKLGAEARDHARTSMSCATQFLSKYVHNPHRFLGSGTANRDIRAALQQWAQNFRLENHTPELPLTRPA